MRKPTQLKGTVKSSQFIHNSVQEYKALPTNSPKYKEAMAKTRAMSALISSRAMMCQERVNSPWPPGFQFRESAPWWLLLSMQVWQMCSGAILGWDIQRIPLSSTFIGNSQLLEAKLSYRSYHKLLRNSLTFKLYAVYTVLFYALLLFFYCCCYNGFVFNFNILF